MVATTLPPLNLEEYKTLKTLKMSQPSSKKRMISAVSSISVDSTSHEFEDKIGRERRKEAEDAKKKRGKAIEWEKKYEFDMKVYAESEMCEKIGRDFAQHRNTVTKLGVVKEYWCKYGKKKGFACPVKIKIIEKGNKVYFYDEKEPKECNHVETSQKGMKRTYENYNEEETEAIKEAIELDMNTRNIKKAIKKKKLRTDQSMPKASSFYHKVNQLKKELEKDQVKITVDKFKELLEKNSAVPEDDDEAYIVKSYLKVSGETPKFSILVSTKKLIERNLVEQTKGWCLLADATYQTNMEEAPVILFGANSFETGKKFDGIGAVISSNEDKPTYDFLFQFVKDFSSILPAAVMADGSAAVSASCKDVLPLSLRLMCWYHTSKKVQDRLKGIKNIDSDVASQIYDDIKDLQSGVCDEESFFIIAALLKRKWLEEKTYMDETLKLRVHEFYLYFTKVWLQSDIQKWYEAANPMMLSTNNSLEANNNVLKRDYTGRMRLSMPNLVEKVKEMAEKWSKDPAKTVSREAEISLSLRKQAEGLLEEIEEFILIRTAKKSDRSIVKVDKGVVTGRLKLIGICPRKAYQITTKEKFSEDGKEAVKRRNSLDYDDFNQFKDDLKKVAIFEVVKLTSGGTEVFCNCLTAKKASGCKGDICVHICAKLIQDGKLGKLSVPRQLSNTVAKKRMPKNKKQLY